jgi:hypothetical protein
VRRLCICTQSSGSLVVFSRSCLLSERTRRIQRPAHAAAAAEASRGPSDSASDPILSTPPKNSHHGCLNPLSHKTKKERANGTMKFSKLLFVVICFGANYHHLLWPEWSSVRFLGLYHGSRRLVVSISCSVTQQRHDLPWTNFYGHWTSKTSIEVIMLFPRTGRRVEPRRARS